MPDLTDPRPVTAETDTGLGGQATFWTTALIGAAAAGALSLIDSDAFEKYFGAFDPLLVVASAAVLGSVSLRFLRTRGWWTSASRGELVRGLRFSSVAALGLGAIAIAVDIWLRFPESMNVTWPRSTLFYTAIAFVAEVAFHVLPLALIVAVTKWRFADRGADLRVWICIAVVALVEAGFQVIAGSSLDLFVGPHLFVVGVFELVAFRRYGYLSMFWFRIMYYLVWHIAWGHVRLELLF